VVGAVTVVLPSVTAAVRASSRPCTETPVVAVMLSWAIRVPAKDVPVPRVAELPTCQKTLQAWAPPVRSTELLLAVVSVEAALKTNTAAGSPPASRVRVLVRSNEDVDP
jgi:hypothetical protein